MTNAEDRDKIKGMLFGILFSFFAFSSAGAEVGPAPAATPSGKMISGVVRIIRSQPETEVFFKDHKDSVIIIKDSKHNLFYEACEESRKKNQPVSLLIHPVSRQVISLPEKKVEGSPSTLDPVLAPSPGSNKSPASRPDGTSEGSQ